MTSRKKIVYIAGPMTGLKGFNEDSFKTAEQWLKASGHEVRNPACLGVWANYEHYLEVDLVMLGQCDSIVFLPGSDQSPGATREAKHAAANGIVPELELLAPVWDLLARMYGANS